jgi:putative ABC transport system permease protein
MTLIGIAARNVLRSKTRAFMTLAAVAITLLVFVLLRTVQTAWTAGADYAAKDRLGTRHKVSFVLPLPKSYIDKLRAEGPRLGITESTWANWFGGQHPTRKEDIFATIAVDPESFLRVYDEIVVAAEARESWLANRRGALVGDVLAKKFGWKPGDKIVLAGTIFPGEWEFEISGIYTAAQKSVDRSTFWFHWNYLNESDRVAERNKNKIGWIVSRVDDASRTAQISKEVDALFDDRGDQTITMSERALQNSFLGMFSAILSAIDIVSVVILVIMLLILGNTIAMSVRERTNEYGMMRAIGFMPRHIAVAVLGESVTVGLTGGLVGLGLSHLFINKAVGPFLEENMGGWFPYFGIASSTAITAIVLAVLLGAVAALVPATRAARLNTVEALRRVE